MENKEKKVNKYFEYMLFVIKHILIFYISLILWSFFDTNFNNIFHNDNVLKFIITILYFFLIVFFIYILILFFINYLKNRDNKKFKKMLFVIFIILLLFKIYIFYSQILREKDYNKCKLKHWNETLKCLHFKIVTQNKN